MVEPVYCVHCGAVAKHPVYKTIAGQSLAFCCNGCLQIYEMLHEEDAPSTIETGPAGSIEPTSPVTAANGSFLPVTLHIEGMSCANCVATVERSLRKVAGVRNVSVSLATETATLEIDRQKVSMDDLRKAVIAAGYR